MNWSEFKAAHPASADRVEAIIEDAELRARDDYDWHREHKFTAAAVEAGLSMVGDSKHWPTVPRFARESVLFVLLRAGAKAREAQAEADGYGLTALAEVFHWDAVGCALAVGYLDALANGPAPEAAP